MKKIYFLFFIYSVSINSQTLNFGEHIENKKITNNIELAAIFNSKEKFDISFKAKVTDVCQMKGCWMKLDIGNNEEVMVNFKDYGFFVPIDIKDKEVIVSGEAFTRYISIEELKHYARDRGESGTIINEINKPKEIYSLTANGVILFN